MAGIVGIEELGRRIRKLRIERRMTLKQVEEAAGLSATHISEIERGRTSPTIGALVRIARALEKDASFFIEAEERADAAFVARNDARPAGQPGGVTVEALTPGVPGSRIFAYRLTFPGSPGAELHVPSLEHAGDAVYLVRRGSVETDFGGTRATLEPGDAAQASSLIDHRLRATAGGSAEVIAVLTRSLEDR
jgi:transcriptional regulator with XRE-family HTH domain